MVKLLTGANCYRVPSSKHGSHIATADIKGPVSVLCGDTINDTEKEQVLESAKRKYEVSSGILKINIVN